MTDACQHGGSVKGKMADAYQNGGGLESVCVMMTDMFGIAFVDEEFVFDVTPGLDLNDVK